LRPVADADRYNLAAASEPRPDGPAALSPTGRRGVPRRFLAKGVRARRRSSPGLGGPSANVGGRHWLDLVGFADQIGTANDIFAEHALALPRLTSSTPSTPTSRTNRFIREQVAGDLLPFESARAARGRNSWRPASCCSADLTIVEADKAKLRIEVVDQQVDKIGRAFLGMTIGCARCHEPQVRPRFPSATTTRWPASSTATDSIQRAEWGIWSWPMLADLPETEAQESEREARAERERQHVDRLEGRPRPTPRPEGGNRRRPWRSPELPPTTSRLGRLSPRSRPNWPSRSANSTARIQHGRILRPGAAESLRGPWTPQKPADMKITIRGNAYALGDPRPRAGSLGVASCEPSPPIPPRESGRRQLADWIAGPRQPIDLACRREPASGRSCSVRGSCGRSTTSAYRASGPSHPRAARSPGRDGSSPAAGRSGG